MAARKATKAGRPKAPKAKKATGVKKRKSAAGKKVTFPILSYANLSYNLAFFFSARVPKEGKEKGSKESCSFSR